MFDSPSLFYGLFLGLYVPVLVMVVQQTWQIWRHTRRFSHLYLYMIWIDSMANLIVALTTFLFLNGIIPPSIGYYIGTILLWILQTQLFAQIIANRITIIMVNKERARYLSWSLVFVIGIINIAVAAIWIPAHLPSATKIQIKTNYIFEYIEKTLLLFIDLGLNLCFLHLVRFHLIRNGLNKYWRLFKFNIGMVCISVSMDGLLLGMLSLRKHYYYYVQFSPVAYIIKLYIELNMIAFIGKIVRSSIAERAYDLRSTSNRTPSGIQLADRTEAAAPPMLEPETVWRGSVNANARIPRGNFPTEDDLLAGHEVQAKSTGILKTTTATTTQSEIPPETSNTHRYSG